ncbi:hypothetical protein P2Q00_15835 [Streptomyces coacervatus]|uniref:hypothetical protein n=1 Tax=Streptomyces coacervatus TaxID=647381 RepID=UPI0023DA4DA5|nr:hypothetical protein [Streptomyces coacervatus]MDF2266887.1 hypothetical protein [Streptomyces coacervatus]
MASLRSSRPTQPHQLFSGVFADWSARAGAFSALPDAPVVPDDSRQRRRPVLRRQKITGYSYPAAK